MQEKLKKIEKINELNLIFKPILSKENKPKNEEINEISLKDLKIS
jgi:hypothetical protein